MMKKILSIVLAVALCLTAMVGCLTVSADGAATATVATVEVDAGTATADVAITIAGDAIAATYIDVALPELALVGVASATDGLNAMHNSVNAEGVEDFTVADAANAIRILLDSAEGIVDYTSLSVVLTFNTADAAVGEYAVTVTGSDAADSNEAAVVISPVAGAVVVKEVVTGPVLDESITLTTAINITETINARVVISKEVANYADYDLVISRQKAYYVSAAAGYALTDVQEFVYNKADAYSQLADGRGLFLYNELGMYELGIDFTIMVKCYDAEGNYVAYSNATTTNIGKLAYALYSPANASAKNKNIAIDIAKLGDKAQAYMVNGIDCGLATITSPLSYFPADATEGSVFDANALDTTNVANSAVAGMTLTPTVNLSSNPALRILSSAAGAYDVADISLDVDYINAKNGSDNGVVLAGADLSTAGSGASVRYYTLYNKIALYDTNIPITATLYAGETELCSVEYSIEAYVAANYNHAKMGAVLQAVANLGTSARAYFGM